MVFVIVFDSKLEVMYLVSGKFLEICEVKDSIGLVFGVLLYCFKLVLGEICEVVLVFL